MTNIEQFKIKLQEYINHDFQCLYDSDEFEKKERELDQLIGLISAESENVGKFPDQKESYTDEEINLCALNTSYADWYQFLSKLNPKSTICDLGSGHSKGSIISALFPNFCQVKSYEYIEQRVSATKKALQINGLSHENIYHCNFLDEFPRATKYYIYLPAGNLVHKILSQLQHFSLDEQIEIYAVESHGDLINFISKEEWLTKDELLTLKTPRHDTTLYLFKSKDKEKIEKIIRSKKQWVNETNSLLKQNKKAPIAPLTSFYDQRDLCDNYDQIIFQDERGLWIGDMMNAELCLLDKNKPFIELTYPKRRIPYSQAIALLRPSKKIQESIVLRREQKNLRKIYIKPDFFVETI